MAALIEGRQFIGIELSEPVAMTAVGRLRATQLRPTGHADQGALDLVFPREEGTMIIYGI